MPVFEVQVSKGSDILPRWTRYGDLLGNLIDQTTDDAAQVMYEHIPPYPPERPNQRYVRTGTLDASFYINHTGRNQVRIGNMAWYAPWVISDEAVGGVGPQAWFHVGRWYTLQGVLDQNKGSIINVFRQAIMEFFADALEEVATDVAEVAVLA